MTPKHLPPAWIVQYNPNEQNFSAAIQYLRALSVPVDAYEAEMQAGDTLYLWETEESGIDGIIAVCRVTAPCAVGELTEEEKPFVGEHQQGNTARVTVAVERVLREPYPRTELIKHPWTKNAEFLNAPTRQTFRLTPQQERAIRAHTVGDMVPPIYFRITLDLPFHRWHECRENGYVYIGWDQTGDLRQFSSRDQLLRVLQERDPATDPATLVGRANQLWELREIRPGDRVVVTERERVRAWGRVEAPAYEWKNGRHAINMSWHDWDFWVEGSQSWSPGSVGRMDLSPTDLTQALAEDYLTKAQVRETRLELRLTEYWRRRLSHSSLPLANLDVNHLTAATKVIFRVAYGQLTEETAYRLLEKLDQGAFDHTLENVYRICQDEELRQPWLWHDVATRDLERVLRAKVKQMTGQTINKSLPALDSK